MIHVFIMLFNLLGHTEVLEERTIVLISGCVIILRPVVEYGPALYNLIE